MREAFEARAVANGSDVARSSNGEYSDIRVEVAWCLWASGAMWVARECVKECEAQFECCGDPVVGAEYMGEVERICCGTPIVSREAADDVADAIRARFPEAFR
jgi:hypothetical protein